VGFAGFIGEAGQLFYNTSTGELRLTDGHTVGGVPVYVATNSANVGNLSIANTTISTLTASANINIQTTGVGNINVVGGFLVATPNGSPIIQTLQNGSLNLYTPIQNSTDSGIDIIGSASGAVIPPTSTGVMLHITGQGTLSSKVYNDAFGNYALYAGRRYDNTVDTPYAVGAGEDVVRYGGTAYNGVAAPVGGIAHIRITTTEAQTVSSAGSNISIWTTPIGSTTLVKTASFDGANATVTNLTANNFINIGNSLISGTSTLVGIVTTSGNLNVVGNLTTTGNNITTGTTLMTGNTISSGTTYLTGIVTAEGNVNVQGNLTTQGNSYVVGNSINQGTTLMIGNIIANGTTNLIGTLTANGVSTLNGNVYILGNMSTTGAAVSFGSAAFTGPMTQTGIFTVYGDTFRSGNVTDTGIRTQNGPMFINNQLTLSGTGNIAFNDGSVQTTAAIGQINNSGHITGSFSYSSSTRVLNLTSDATPSNQPSTIVSRDNNGNTAVGNISAYTINTTAATANSAIAGNLTVYGNLNVKGTTTTTNSTQQTTSGLTITVANNAATSSAADGAGLVVANANYAELLYSDSQQAWISSIDMIPLTTLSQSLGNANRKWLNMYAGNAYVTGELTVGVQPISDFNTIAQFTSNANSYAQTVTQNISNLSAASSDYIAAADVGSASTNFIDMGINSSGYSDPAYTLQYPLDGYVYTNGGNITIGTQTTQKAVVFHTGGTLAANEAGRISAGRWLLGAVDDGTSKLQVNGNAAITYVSGTGVALTGNISANYHLGNASLMSGLANNQAFTSINANVAAANAAIASTTANVVAANSAISSINANVTAANSAITTNTNNITTINANIVAANSAISTLTSNAATQANLITTVNANVTAANSAITSTNANVTAANSAITSTNANVTAANSAITTNTNNITTINANVAAANSAITSLGTNANTVTAAYLTVYTGNIKAGNLAVTGNITASGVTLVANIVAGNSITTGTETMGTLAVTGNGTVTGNLTVGNASTSGNFVGNLSGIASKANNLVTASNILAGQLSITPTAIGKNSTSTQTFTLTGLTTSHRVVVTLAADQAYGVIVGAAYASSLNTLSIQFHNFSGGGITPAATTVNYFAWT
jgi:hypothetical protein